MSNSLTACFGGNADLTSDPKYISKLIDEQLRIAKKLAKSQIKLLVLGAAESGKSTFIKQMQIIHGTGYTEEKRKEFKTTIHQNVLTSIRLLSFGMDKLELKYENEENKDFGTNFSLQTSLQDSTEYFTKEFVQNIQKFWKDEGIQSCYKRRNEFHLLDSASYFLNEIERISKSNYLPSLQDVLRSRNPTSGICEYVFDVDKFIFGMVDVGGQKTERRKWIHCFDNVNSIIFLASLSEYDQTIPQEEINQELAYSNQQQLLYNTTTNGSNGNSLARHNSSSSGNYRNNDDSSNLLHTNTISHNHQSHRQHNRNRTVVRAYSQQTIRHGHHEKLERKDSKMVKSKQHRGPQQQRGATLPPFPSNNKPLLEDGCYDNINRMRESCALFQTIVHSSMFRSTSVILFLNKTDILQEKVQYSHLRLYDSTYEGADKDADAARNHILERYIKCFNHRSHRSHSNAATSKRTLYSHFTCATDTNNIRFVFAAIKDIILQNYLENYNLI